MQDVSSQTKVDIRTHSVQTSPRLGVAQSAEEAAQTEPDVMTVTSQTNVDEAEIASQTVHTVEGTKESGDQTSKHESEKQQQTSMSTLR